MLLLTGTSGMAFGGWSAGVIHDAYGYYQPAFATGLAANVVNFLILASLVGFWWRGQRTRVHAMDAQPAGS
jgi:hypothetical protein